MGDVNFIGGTTLGKIQKWSDTKAAVMTPIPFPGKDADKTEAVDTLGIISYTNFSGRWTGNFETIQDNIYAIKSIADGFQITSQTFKSPFIVATFDKSGVTERRQGNIGVNTSTTASKLIDINGSFTVNNQQIGDIVKNLVTEDTATVTLIDSDTTLSLSADIFPVAGGTGVAYACTATINCKVLSIETNWELPGLSYCDYKISVIQVR